MSFEPNKTTHPIWVSTQKVLEWNRPFVNLTLMFGYSAGSPGYHLHRWQHGCLAGYRLRYQRECGQAGGRAGSGEQDRHQEYLHKPRRQTLGVGGSQRDAEVGKKRGWAFSKSPWENIVGLLSLKLCDCSPAGFSTLTAWRRSWRWRPTTQRSSVWSTASPKLVGVSEEEMCHRGNQAKRQCLFQMTKILANLLLVELPVSPNMELIADIQLFTHSDLSYCDVRWWSLLLRSRFKHSMLQVFFDHSLSKLPVPHQVWPRYYIFSTRVQRLCVNRICYDSF